MKDNISNSVSAFPYGNPHAAGQKSDKANMYVLNGFKLIETGKYREGLSCCLRSLMIERNNPAAYFGAGLAYKYLNNYDKAIKNFQKSAEINPDNYKTHYETGICYLLKSAPEKALRYFQKSIVIDKTKPDVQLQLALTHELINEDDMAMEIYDTLIERYPDYIKARSHKAALLVCRGEYFSACKIFFEILKINPDFHRAYLGLAVCFDNIKKIPDAKRFYSKFLKMCPDSYHSNYVKNRILVLRNQKHERPEYMSLI